MISARRRIFELGSALRQCISFEYGIIVRGREGVDARAVGRTVVRYVYCTRMDVTISFKESFPDLCPFWVCAVPEMWLLLLQTHVWCPCAFEDALEIRLNVHGKKRGGGKEQGRACHARIWFAISIPRNQANSKPHSGGQSHLVLAYDTI